MRISDQGIGLLKELEGFSPRLYQDAGHWAIGYGCDLTPAEAALWQDKTISPQEADDLLRKRLEPVERAINRLVRVPLGQNAFDALCCFVYNVGVGAFSRSRLLFHLNQGDYTGAANELLKWSHSEGKVNPGLSARRNRERNLFLSTQR